jgi:hypothetical protein
MNINRSNYEVYFLDYLDGNLPEGQVDDFLDFLDNNPDLHQELKEVSSVKLSAGKQVFRNKEVLLKDGWHETSTFDYQSVAFLEGGLSEEDRDSFLTQITDDPEKEKQFDLFLKTKLQPDKNLVFPNKEGLYRKSTVSVFLLWGSRVAALLILLFGIWPVWNFSFKTSPAIQYSEEKAVVPQQQTEEEALPLPEQTEKPGPTTEKLIADAAKAIGPVVPTIKKQPLAIDHEQAVGREEAPQKIGPLLAKVEQRHDKEPIALAAMGNPKIDKPEDVLTVDEFLAQKILNKSKGEPLHFSNIVSAGLDAVSNASNERLVYETNRNGGVSEITLNTRLLAFSIPLKKDK